MYSVIDPCCLLSGLFESFLSWFFTKCRFSNRGENCRSTLECIQSLFHMKFCCAFHSSWKWTSGAPELRSEVCHIAFHFASGHKEYYIKRKGTQFSSRIKIWRLSKLVKKWRRGNLREGNWGLSMLILHLYSFQCPYSHCHCHMII